ncbi:4Fe-4S dicluster domain protein [Leptospira ryugenii]|uniref:4Fe-4S dicluster domain protein n=1 Tax=Leptospira ryugenii TaxID=1917863 RepID=A0A2P2E0U8_9LEPT|nr:4Fe-4S binding protein [Leptospira ryugenii]GBF50499.1 4Fe-4S dicluster domain protein [Leptospira ryugenii]
MKRKDLFKTGFQSVFQFAFEKSDEIGQAIEKVWQDEKKPPSEKNLTEVKKISEPKKKATVKSQLFSGLSLPPGKAEDFFSRCTGCNDCIFSCPYTVLFPVNSEKTGQRFPFFDPNAKACHLCSDWPCIQACNEGALLIENVQKENPKFGIAKPLSEHCINHKTNEKTCDVCESVCPIEKTVVFKGFLPSFSKATCTGCGLCVEACPSFPKAIQIKTKKQY